MRGVMNMLQNPEAFIINRFITFFKEIKMKNNSKISVT